MGRVSHLVGIDADQPRLHSRPQAIQIVRFKGRLLAKMFFQRRCEQADKAAAARELHFKGQTLTFVQAVGTRGADRLAQPVARQVLFVTGMAGLVDGAEQAACKIAVAVARGQAHILRHAAAERMRTLVEPPRREIETEQRHHFLVQRALRRHRERALRSDDFFTGLFRLCAGDQVRQPGFDVAENAVDIGRAHARLKPIHQRVIPGQTRVISEELCLFACEFHHLAEIFEKALPVIGLTLAAPGVFAAGTGQRPGFDQRFRQCIGIAPVATDLAQIGTRSVVQRLGLRSLQPGDQPRISTRAMDQRREFGFRRGTRFVATGRHHRVAIPADDGGEMMVAVEPGVNAGQLGVIGRGGGRCAHLETVEFRTGCPW